MISKKKTNNGIIIKQKANLPTVYLDSWAYSTFASDKILGNKFRKVMLEKKGTLLVSTISLLEICNIRDVNFIKDILEIYDEIDFVFIESSAPLVIDREIQKRDITSESSHNSPVTPDWLKDFVIDLKHNPPYKFSDAFWTLKNERVTIESVNDMINQEIIKYNILVNELREMEDPQKDLEKEIKKYSVLGFPLTNVLWKHCLLFLSKNKELRLNRNHWLDIFHTIVPVAYAEFVVLDKTWFEFISQTRFKYPHIANVYTKKNLDDFFLTLEKYISP